MSKFRVDYKFEGSIEIEADTVEEAYEEFHDVSDRELVENCYFGVQIEDIRIIG